MLSDDLLLFIICDDQRQWVNRGYLPVMSVCFYRPGVFFFGAVFPNNKINSFGRLYSSAKSISSVSAGYEVLNRLSTALYITSILSRASLHFSVIYISFSNSETVMIFFALRIPIGPIYLL